MGGRGSWAPVESLDGSSSAPANYNLFDSKGLWRRMEDLPTKALPATGIQNGLETSNPASGVRPCVTLYCLPLNPDLAPIFP
jgi:hypothetical protein